MKLPYGYRMIDGRIEIDEASTEQVRTLYREYLSGKSYSAAIIAAGLTMPHGQAKLMMQNKKYLGNDIYPAIIDKETFLNAELERVKRQGQLGRFFESKPRNKNNVMTKFKMREATEHFDDPFDEAAYIYSLIESEGKI